MAETLNPGGVDKQLQSSEDNLPTLWKLWRWLLHTTVTIIYFAVITFVATGIDLGLHWFERRPSVESYGLSPVIRWEIEGTAYILTLVDCLLFLWQIIQPVVRIVRGMRKR